MYVQIYITILYVTRMTQNKNDSINLILQHGRVVGKNYCAVFLNSGFPYLTLCLRQCKWKVATTCLATRTKRQGLRAIKIFEYENLLLLKPL